MLCIFETVTLPLRASVSCQTWGPTWTWFSKGGDSILAGSSRALRSGRVLCDPGQVAFLLCLGKCVGEPSGTPPAGSVILSSAPGGSSRSGHLWLSPCLARRGY